ncbi:hypothetical protein LCGC14_2383410 [marine sediment metagenome]|uniref:Uncharacterized protein n=1 Tax=marine sediment metagenome TaxID=412755 RepID=A0A0F9EUW3_9ZZZZ
MPEKQFRFEIEKHIDKQFSQVIWSYGDKVLGEGNILTPEEWEIWKEVVLRTKVKCE